MGAPVCDVRAKRFSRCNSVLAAFPNASASRSKSIWNTMLRWQRSSTEQTFMQPAASVKVGLDPDLRRAAAPTVWSPSRGVAPGPLPPLADV